MHNPMESQGYTAACTLPAVGDVEVLGANLKRLRKKKKMTQQELADAAGLHKNTIINWERAKVADVDSGNVRRVAEALGCDPADLLDQPGSSRPVAEILPEYLASPWYQIDKPTPEEIQELTSKHAISWLGGEDPDPEAVHLYIESRRTAQARR